VGQIQLAIDLPESLKQNPHTELRGLALIAHPHPLLGGTMDNKVVQTLARTFNQLDYVCV
jgi:alpha/beta superfamily hydrolase